MEHIIVLFILALMLFFIFLGSIPKFVVKPSNMIVR